MVGPAASRRVVAIHERAYVMSMRAGRLRCRLVLGRNQMQKFDTFAHAAKVVALSLPPVVLSLIGLAALSRRKGGVVAAAAKRPPAATGTRGWRKNCSPR